jgi:hypothetical protein
VKLDVASQSLVAEREWLRVSWFATDGAFAESATGRAAGDPATTTDDSWTAPSQPGPLHLWIVLRDARGGVDFQASDIQVVR